MEKSLVDWVSDRKIEYPEQYWSQWSATSRDCVKQMLQIDPAQRLTARELMRHPWLMENDNATNANLAPLQPPVLTMMRAYNAERRLKRAINVVFFSAALWKRVLPPISQSLPEISQQLDQMKLAGTGRKTSSLSQVSLNKASSVSFHSSTKSRTASRDALPNSGMPRTLSTSRIAAAAALPANARSNRRASEVPASMERTRIAGLPPAMPEAMRRSKTLQLLNNSTPKNSNSLSKIGSHHSLKNQIQSSSGSVKKGTAN